MIQDYPKRVISRPKTSPMTQWNIFQKEMTYIKFRQGPYHHAYFALMIWYVSEIISILVGIKFLLKDID